MFSDQEIEEFINEEEDTWRQTVNQTSLIDPPMEQSGPRLHEEFNMQEWQKLVQLSTPMPEIHDYAEATCLRVKRISSGLGRFYYRAGYNNSWGDSDLEEMSKTPAPEILLGMTPRVEDTEVEVSKVERPKRETPEPDRSIAHEKDVKTRMQITLKRQGKNVRGHTGNFVVHGVRASKMVEVLGDLMETFPKIKRSVQTVRIQFTEYRLGGGSYRPERGGNMNLHNAEVGPVIAFITSKLASVGLTLQGREWTHEKKAVIKSPGLDQIREIIGELPDAINITNVPYNNSIHGGLWCLCRIRNGGSWVLLASNNVSDILEEQKDIGKFTYVLNQQGSMHRV